MEDNELSCSSLNYLDSIYRQSKLTGSVHSVNIANDLNVTKPSVTRAVKILIEEGLVYKNSRGEISLTDEGNAAAKSLSDKCNTLREFFNKTIGNICGIPTQEIGRFSYSMSDEVMDRIQTYLKG